MRAKNKKKMDVEDQYNAILNRLTDDIFEEATYTYDWTWNQLAENANCSYGTVHRLGNRESNPMLRTIVKLANSVGLGLQLSKLKLFAKSSSRGLNRKRKAG